MFRKVLCVLSFPLSLLVSHVYGQLLFPDAGSMASAHAVSADQGPESIFFNPSGFPAENGSTLLVTLAFPYIRLDLRNIALAYGKQLGPVYTATGIEVMGDNLYQLAQIHFSLARDFGEFRLGMRPSLIRESTVGSEGRLTGKIRVGCQWPFSPSLRAGFVFSRQIGNGPPANDIRAGILYHASEKWKLAGEWVVNPSWHHSLSLGMRYKPGDRLSFATGIRLLPSRIYLGIRFQLHKVLMDYSTGHDPFLGGIHAFSFRWFKSRKE